MSINLHWGWPQLIVLLLLFGRIIMHCSNHGQPTNQKWDGPGAIFAVVVWLGLLWWGGFL